MKNEMRFADYLVLVRTSMFRRKVFSFLNIFFITLGLVSLLSILSVSQSLRAFIDTTFYTTVDARTLTVSAAPERHQWSQEEAMNNILALPYIISAYQPANSAGTLVNHPVLSQHSFDGHISVKAIDPKILPPLVAGRAFTPKEVKVGIIPDKFSPTIMSSGREIRSGPYIDGRTLLGQELTLEYYYLDFTKGWEYPLRKPFDKLTFKVIGVYNSGLSWEQRNLVYLPYEDVKLMQDARANDILPEGYESPIIREGVNFRIVVDKMANVDQAVIDINSMGFMTTPISWMDHSVWDRIELIALFISGLLMAVALLNTFVSSRVSFKNRVAEVGMLKAMGFPNWVVKKLFVLELLFLGIFSYAISIALTLGVLYGAKNYLFYPSGFPVKMPMSLDALGLGLSLLIALGLPVLGGLATIKRAAALSPAVAMRDK